MIHTLQPALLIVAATILGVATQPPPAVPPTGIPVSQEKKTTAEIGEKAPPFELKDQHGKTHKLADYKDKIVVLEWFNETCPYCKKAWGIGLVSKLLEDLQTSTTEVVYLAINSTANRPEEEVLEGGKEFLDELEVPASMLMDYDGKVGREYGARTTPHMYVIDTDGVLVYQGALSDDRRFKEGKDAKTHIMRVVHQLNAGEEVSPSYVQPWGCPVKYKPDNNARKKEKRGGSRK